MSGLFDFFGDEKFRFCMVDANQKQCSSDWIVWANNGSLYFSIVVLGGALKFSMHPRGTSIDGNDCQFGASNNLWSRIRHKEHSQKIPFHRWKRPRPIADQFSLVASIFFPTDALRNRLEPRILSRKKVGFLLPESGKAAEVGIFSHSIDVEVERNMAKLERTFSAIDFLPMVDFDLCGERATVAVRSVDFPFPTDEIASGNSEENVFLGNPLQVGQTVDRAHAIAVPSWPEDGQPLILAEVNGFSLKFRGSLKPPAQNSPAA